MINVPACLYNREIKSYIKDIILDKKNIYFSSIDIIHKRKLGSLAMKAIGSRDLEIIMSPETSESLAKFLLSQDPDDKIQLFSNIENDSFEHFSAYFDQMFSDMHDEINSESFIDAGYRSYRDRQTGEVLWSKSA